MPAWNLGSLDGAAALTLAHCLDAAGPAGYHARPLPNARRIGGRSVISLGLRRQVEEYRLRLLCTLSTLARSGGGGDGRIWPAVATHPGPLVLVRIVDRTFHHP